MTNEHAPSAVECIRFEVALQARIDNFVALETARRYICAYGSDPCDCKYGAGPLTPCGSEATGCCEIRDMITQLTDWTPFNRGQSPSEEAEALAERERSDWLADYSDQVEGFLLSAFQDMS